MSEQNQTEEALRESEQKFRALFQGIPVPVYAWQQRGEDFVLIDHNEAANAITGGTMGDFLGTSVSAMYPDRPDIVDDISRCFTEKVSFQREMAYSFKTTGENKVLVVKYAFVPPDLVLVHTEDITERKKWEQVLRESQESFRVAFDSANMGQCLVDLQGNLLRVNRAMCDIFGYSKEELESMTVNDIAHPDDQDLSPRFIERATSGEISRSEFEKRYFHKEGHIIWGRVTSALVRDPDDTPRYFISHVEDITERKKGEQALQESQSRLANILETAMDAIITVNEDQLLVMVNPAAKQMFGVEGKDIVGRPLDEFIPARFHKKHTDHIRSFGQTKVTARSMGKMGTLWGRRANGEEFPIEVSISQVDVSGEKLYTAIIRDITERKLLEGQIQESATLEERNRIARELHDSVTQSLYSINLQSDATAMALSSGRVEDAEKRLQTLKGIAQESMSEMRLLIYELHPSILEEAGLVAALRQRLVSVESRSGIEVDLQVEGEKRLPIAVEEELYQISLEGLNNVLKHAKAKEVLVRLSFEHDRCRLMIQDDGVGFDLELSDRFGGYGLANIKDRLEQIGGELTIITEPGKGTTLDIEVIL